jgi:hypothetical protein
MYVDLITFWCIDTKLTFFRKGFTALLVQSSVILYFGCLIGADLMVMTFSFLTFRVWTREFYRGIFELSLTLSDSQQQKLHSYWRSCTPRFLFDFRHITYPYQFSLVLAEFGANRAIDFSKSF